MATVSRNVNLSKGTTSLSPAGAITIKKDTNLKLKPGSGFAGTAQVSKVTLYTWSTNPADRTLVGSWQRSSPSAQPSSALSIGTNGNNVTINDVDTVADINYCFTASVHDNNGDHTTVDPELIVKKRN